MLPQRLESQRDAGRLGTGTLHSLQPVIQSAAGRPLRGLPHGLDEDEAARRSATLILPARPDRSAEGWWCPGVMTWGLAPPAFCWPIWPTAPRSRRPGERAGLRGPESENQMNETEHTNIFAPETFVTSGQSPGTAHELSPNGRAALEYAARGWHVFPVAPLAGDPHAEPGSPDHDAYKQSKAPHRLARRDDYQGRPEEGSRRVLKGKDAATTRLDLIRRWWTRDPSARIGCNLKPSGLIAVDLDDYKTEDRQRLDLPPLPAGLPETLTSRSPSGGSHRLYVAPDGARTRNFRDGEVLWNRYIVLPSPDSGYQWVDASAPVAELPEPTGEVLFGRHQTASAEADVAGLEQREAELVRWLDGSGLGEYRLKRPADGRVVAELKLCPFDLADHSAPYKAVVGRASGGGWFAQCVVAGCAGLGWEDLRHRSPLPPAESAPFGYHEDGLPLPALALPEAAVPDDAERWFSPWHRRMTLMGRDDLSALAPPDWLVPGYLQAGVLAELAGPSGIGKSFLALDWALRLSSPLPTGVEFVDRSDPEPGRHVLYFAAEGANGLLRRIEAWERENDQAWDDRALMFRPDVPSLLEAGSLSLYLTMVQDTGPWDLIVIDTLARSIVGADENSAQDMGRVVDAAEKIRRAAGGATVLLVHHFGKNSDEERGSSALFGAMDNVTYIHRTSNPGVVKVVARKVKDGADGTVRLRQLSATGASCVLRPVDPANEESPEAVSRVLVLDLLTTHGAMSRAQLQEGLRWGKDKACRILSCLESEGTVTKEKDGRQWIYDVA